MSKVFVLDSSYKPLDPVHPGRARVLLKQGKASVYRRFPFTIILHSMNDGGLLGQLDDKYANRLTCEVFHT